MPIQNKKKTKKKKEESSPKTTSQIDQPLNDKHAFTRFDKINNNSRAFSLHKPARRRFPVRSYRAKYKNQFWQADLEEMIPHEKENKNFKYILTVIDVFSRYAWALPLKNKSAKAVTSALKKIIDKVGLPKFLHTDQGKEFENSILRKTIPNQFSVKSAVKAAIVERFNRTLKSRMYKYFTHIGNYRWYDILQRLVDGYNNTYHRTIKMTPREAYDSKNKKKVFLTQERRISMKKKEKAKFKSGDYVRLSKVKHIFEKGFTTNWTEEIFRVHRVFKKYMPIMYSIKDCDGNIIEGKFYKYELQKVAAPNSFAIEEIYETRANKVRVKLLGYKQSKWIPLKDIVKINE